MVVFVLNHSCKIPLDNLVVRLKILIEPLQLDFLDTGNRFVNTGQTETALLPGLLRPVLQYFENRIYQGQLHIGAFGKILGHRIYVDNDQPDRKSYLRSCQPDTFGSIHRLIHIFNQLFQLRVRSIDLFGLLTNYGMPVKINR